jgi:hypothetical protein
MARMLLQLRVALNTSQSCSNGIVQPSMPIRSLSPMLECCGFVVILFPLVLGFLAFCILGVHVAIYVALCLHLESLLQNDRCCPLRTPEQNYCWARCDHEGSLTLRNQYHVPSAAVRILLELLASVKILLLRTQDRSARNKTFGPSGGTKIHFLPIPL